tara:strand:+ start:2779 stop:3882 length:1104 start_codon:yes stop_codon:yes gene_type:complete
MKFIQFLKEATDAADKKKVKPSTTGQKKPASKSQAPEDKHVAITFGRFNPPHAGHGKLLDAVKAHGGDSGNYRIYPSRSQDHKKNPLSAHDKVGHMRKMFKGHKDAIQNNESQRNVFDILRDLNDEGHEHVTMVVGDDRVKEFEKLLGKYNGLHYDFKSINIKSAGARNPDSDDPIEKLSASQQRKHAASDDHDNFHLGSGSMSKKDSAALMAAVKAGMTPPAKAKKGKKKGESVHEMKLWEYAPKLDFAEFREHYVLNEIFQIGTMVEQMHTGVRGTIVHRGPNYAVFKDDQFGDEFRCWLQDIHEVSDDLSDQSNHSADDGSGNDWKVGTDKYREALQSMTPGQAVKKFSEFQKNINIKRPTTKV